MNDADEIFPDDDAADEIETPVRKRRTLLVRAALLLGMAATVASAFTGNAPSAEEKAAALLAQMKAASGGAQLDAPDGFHEVGAVARDGASVTYETWADLKHLRSVSTQTLGGKTMTQGFDGAVAWSVGPDGGTRTDATIDGLKSTRLSTYLTIGGYFYPDRFPAHAEYRGRKDADGKSYDVLSVTPQDSTPVDLWLDPSSHRLQRISGIDGKESFTGVVQSYKQVDGVWIPFSIKQTQGSHHMDLQLSSVTFGSVPDARFAPPQK